MPIDITDLISGQEYSIRIGGKVKRRVFATQCKGGRLMFLCPECCSVCHYRVEDINSIIAVKMGKISHSEMSKMIEGEK